MATRIQAGYKITDSKGRVTLGGHFANRAVIVEQRGEDEVVVVLARVIPEREAWLYENPKALAMSRTADRGRYEMTLATWAGCSRPYRR